MKKFAVLSLLACALLSFLLPQDPPKFVSFKSVSQGQIKADDVSAGAKEKDGWFKVSSYGMADITIATIGEKNNTAPKGDYKIVKSVDGASPKLDKALANKDKFETVILQLSNDSKGGQRAITSITLKNAYLDSLRRNGSTETLYFKFEEIVKGY